MSSTKDPLKLLFRKKPLRLEDWLILVETRAEQVKPLLKISSLPELGHTRCLRLHSIRDDHPLEFDSPRLIGVNGLSLTLKTQGVFSVGYKKHYPGTGYKAPPGDVSYPNGYMALWGFTRDGEWVVATVNFVGVSDYKYGKEVAKSVKILQTNLASVVNSTGVEPETIWDKLGEVVWELTRRREQLYKNALNFAQSIERQDFVISQIPR